MHDFQLRVFRISRISLEKYRGGQGSEILWLTFYEDQWQCVPEHFAG